MNSILQLYFLWFTGVPKLKFLPRRFVTPPLEWRHLYGRELRQTSLEAFVVKTENVVFEKRERKKKVNQSVITRFFAKNK
jgi:hypothetical protein